MGGQTRALKFLTFLVYTTKAWADFVVSHLISRALHVDVPFSWFDSPESCLMIAFLDCFLSLLGSRCEMGGPSSSFVASSSSSQLIMLIMPNHRSCGAE